ncbi:hypothetical protein GBA52_012330 [Prunus armeniaca]|nr:hypothetical protein GBA52_012330 [Prunus armeniaca]
MASGERGRWSGTVFKVVGVRSDLDMEEDKSGWRYAEEMVATGWEVVVGDGEGLGCDGSGAVRGSVLGVVDRVLVLGAIFFSRK